MHKVYTIYAFIIYLFVMSSALAQTDKGDQIAGVQVGNIVLSRKENLGSAVLLKPIYGVFISKGLVAGVGIPFYHFTNNSSVFSIRTTQIGVSPFVRYYVGSSIIKPFISVSGGLLRTSIVENSVRSAPKNNLLYSLGGGAALFLNESISVDLLVNYTGVNDKDYYTPDGYVQNSLGLGFANAININLAFQIYFGSK